MKFAALLMLAAMLVGPPAEAEDPQPPFDENAQVAPDDEKKPGPVLSVKIDVPSKIIIGRMGTAKVVITGDYREVDWEFDPPLPDFKLYNKGKTECYFTTGEKEATYTIDVAVPGKDRGVARARAKVEMAYADGVKAKPRAVVMRASEPSEDIRFWASEIQTSTRDRDVTDLITALNRSGSVSEAKGIFTTLAGGRAAAWNPIFPKFEALLEKLESQGKLGPKGEFTREDHIRGALQSTAKALEAGQ